MSVCQISAVTLAVADMRRACAFYEALGLSCKFGGPAAAFTSFFAGRSFINLDARRAPVAGNGLTILHVDDVDAAYDRAIGAGLNADSAPENAPWGERYFHIRDPDGHTLSFATPLGTHGVAADYPKGCAGIDGCRGGWVAAVRGSAVFNPDLGALLTEVDAAIVAIDMPIGLADDGARACDRAARALLGPRRASVFSPPVRAALDAGHDHAEASRRNAAACGRKLSTQAFNLVRRITELDALLRGGANRPNRVYEAHPELGFAAMAGRPDAPAPLADSKRTWLGARQRMALIDRYFGADAFAAARAGISRRDAGDDDLGDAFGCLFTAERIATGQHTRLPEPPPHDAHGLPMQICY